MADQEPNNPARTPGPELRLVDRRAFVGFPELTLAPGVVVTDFALQIPDITFPLNVSGGASKYQKKKLDFGLLELNVSAEVISREVRALAPKLTELDDVKLHFRAGHLEVQARLRGPERTPVTLKVAFDGDGERLAVYLYDVRLYAFSTVPAARLGALVSEAVKAGGALPDVERRGANGFTTRILPRIVEQAAVARGYKMPSLDQARLAEALVSSKGLTLRFSSGGLPPSGPPDEELLLALEGARAFSEAEELLAQGQVEQARAAYLVLGDATEAHPFAVERLLTLLVADPSTHELALDVAASLARRRERSATALWAEAVVRERRGEFARASERYLALCNLARRQAEEAGAFFAAEAAARASRDDAPQMAVKALHELLGLKPDHLPSLKALARASDQAKDRAGAIRAYRRLAALSRDPADAAEAHVHLARLCAQTDDDIAGARLHCEAALRLAPDNVEALFQLGELCYRSGEWLRAVKALDRLREVAMSRHEVDRVGRANLLAGLVWETGLKQPENALLRFREAASLLPGEAEPLYYAARVAESLGKIQESVAGYQQAIELAGPAPRTEEIRKAAHASHHALARLLKARLGEPARAREHLEAALALDPRDTSALDELLPYFRASGKVSELADACEKAAAVIDDGVRRAALWAEAGELYRGRLNQPEKAERLLTQALEADPKNRLALEGMLALAESRRDGNQLCRCLRALAELAEDGRDRVRHYRRLAVAARDLAFDLELAAHAYREVLRVEPDDLPVLGELTALERRRSDMPGLCWALEQRARVAEQLGDKRLAAAALRELSGVLDGRLGRAGEALVALEKATRLFPEPGALLDLATLSLRVERPLNARRALEDVLALLPKHAPPEKLAEVRARLGRACELLGDKDAARDHYALAFPLRRLDDELAGRLEALYAEARLTRELTDLWASRGQALLQAGRATDAAPLFFRAAQAALDLGDTSGAMLRLGASLEAAPQGERAGDVLELMASLELKRGEPYEAARLYGRRALLTDGRAAARWLFKAAQLTRETPREQGYLAQALEQDVTFTPARYRRAELSENTNPREALADFEAVLSAESRDEDRAGLAVDELALTRRAASAAQRSGNYDAARRLYARYAAQRPDDVEALLELATLHRRAGALEPLVDLLGELWPRLSGPPRVSTRREYAEGALSLGRTAAAVEALRSMLVDEVADEWAATRLLSLLPADEAHAAERLALLGRLLASSTGEARAELLARRAELFRLAGDLTAARNDLLEAAQTAAKPLPLLRALAEYARQARDDFGELAAWRMVLSRPEVDSNLKADAAERLSAVARARTASGDFTGALEALELLVTLPLGPSERCEANLALARAAQAVGNGARAERALLEASKHGPVPRRVEAALERASLLEARGALPEAVETWSLVLELAPRHPAATAGLVRALRVLEDWEGLAEVLSLEAAHTPRAEAAPLFAELATLYLDRLQQVGPGESALRRLVALDEANVDAKLRLGRLLKTREPGEALTLLEASAALLGSGQAAGVLREAAGVAAQVGDPTLELKLLRKAHALSEAVGEDLERLAEALYLHGAVSEALPLQQALVAATGFEENPELAERALLRLADLAEQAGDPALAMQTLRRVVAERPLNASAVERLAALLTKDDPRAALELRARYLESLGGSVRTIDRLQALSHEAQGLGELELSLRLLRRAAELSDAPLPLRLELLALLRASGRTAELMGELAEVAQLHLTLGDIDQALDAWSEEARLCEGNGRIDEALRTLKAMTELCDEEGRTAQAADAAFRRALLLRDSKLDLEAAAGALEEAWNFGPTLERAQVGAQLATRRSDRDGEIDWLERTLTLVEPAAQPALFVDLARLHLGLPQGHDDVSAAPMLAPDQAEAALRRALELDAHFLPAQRLLLALLEREDRMADVAAWYEDAATRAREPKARADALLKAAAIYKDRAERPHEAVGALLAARAADPDDLSLTAKVADLLVALGRRQDAADFDAVVLESEPFHPSFERHAGWLRETNDDLSLAALLSRRAERETGSTAADRWLEAAQAFHRAGATERAQVCETQAFELNPANEEAFSQLLASARDDVRRQAELLATRARAVPGQASELLRRRAGLLADGEPLVAALAWDDYLAVVPDDVDALAARGELAARGGGARAAQPFDRRVVQSAGVSAEVLRAAWWRLGHAAIESQAWRDAADAFEQVGTLDSGSRGREALTLLGEAYAHLNDVEGQYRTTLRVAETSQGAEAEALRRRAVALFEHEPWRALDALTPLLIAHPSEEGLYALGVRALTAQGKVGDLVALHERFASAVGGPAAGRALLEAATLVERDLHESSRAFELRVEAARVAPDNLEAVEAVLAEARRRNDVELVEAQLRRLSERADETRAGELRLELAASLEARGERAQARESLEPIRRQGPSAAGYAQALAALERLARHEEDWARVAELQRVSAELLPPSGRAQRLLDVARTWRDAGDYGRALEAARESLAVHAARPAYEWLVELARASGRADELARALTDLATQHSAAERARCLLEASQAWETAGEVGRARELLERVVSELPTELSADDAATRFLELGQPGRALEVGFEAAVADGRLGRALELADAASEGSRAEQVLARMAPEAPRGPEADRLLGLLWARGDLEGVARLAAAFEPKDATRAQDVWRELAVTHDRAEAAVALFERGALASVVDATGPEVLGVLATHSATLDEAQREQVLVRVANTVPSRRKAMQRELASLYVSQKRLPEAVSVLASLANAEEHATARAALHVERGELLLHGLSDTEHAAAAFERALLDDPRQLGAVRELVRLYQGVRPDRFVAMVELLQELAGDESVLPLREALADAYEALGRVRDAYVLLGQLSDTPELLKRRAELAERLGLRGESLALRERCATTRQELEIILIGYLLADLVPFSVRLGEQLLATGPLEPEWLRLLAERLAPTGQGAALAARTWVQLLTENVADADGWTLFAEALRRLGRAEDAALADGFGAALSSESNAAPVVPARPLPAVVPSTATAPSEVIEISDQSMPRFSAALHEALRAFGVEGITPVLDVTGGSEAWLAGTRLVIGAGALSTFGQAELPFLVALALQLGTAGERLRESGDVPGLEGAVGAAFDAYPASLAASRVVAHLDRDVRGGDPRAVDVTAVLRGSAVFRVMARRALGRLS